MRKKFLLIGFLLIFMLGCEEEESKTLIRPVEVYNVESISNEIVKEYPGIVSAKNESSLAFKISGPLEKLNVEVGSFIKKGEIIGELDKRDYKIQEEIYKNKVIMAENGYNSSKAISENAKQQFTRIEKLYKTKNLPKKSYDEAVAKVKSAIAGEKASFAQYQEALKGLENAKNQLKDTVLVAPYDGYISSKFCDEGSIVGAGQPIVKISSLDDKRIKINISENEIKEFSKISNGKFLYNDIEKYIEIIEIGKVKGVINLSYPVVFKFLEENIDIPVDSQGIVKIDFENEKARGMIIPIESIFERDNQTKVWIYSNGVVNEKNIKIISPYSNGKVIVKGLNIGDKVVSRGVHELSNNQQVELLESFSKTNIGKVL
ncbi:MAG: efflux RND transporter periplasmic adaptor subunit [Fusobacterium perfoetens]|uniref:efflux RND transporter periplasmic adaptor subunit n=1 Tax=Fusobacterium perfoetens TaxID=852 RepID=UPI0023F14979|nr:efflux RND transporter periplasmic adaptor subunit [Fusobacterium perfoetens]MCI6152901.1 efflux RND transporter periplasmic adaptor subunit [Fusobacterium perfoetens]MDY3237313.1 efflux RND transporter periplasmic adaptor subunit [Fusobacterium perfoetens]